VNHYLNKKEKKTNAQLPSCAKFITPLLSFFLEEEVAVGGVEDHIS